MSKKIIMLGVRRSPHGPVGPWHEWDEQGRLLRETIYDALGNRIIHRELDEDQNIIRQEHFEPAALLTDARTGEQRPAPWLWSLHGKAASTRAWMVGSDQVWVRASMLRSVATFAHDLRAFPVFMESGTGGRAIEHDLALSDRNDLPRPR
ncbi:hypothetical protein [Nocardiopsis sp. MG754419]|uniref:hypothetical protein n=1 Tax=Nocardiopsis sp. MG754419 TaxID=2259865 RepID=UPI001BA4CB2E|nr:hypothetical protein [Nocardiopsis sp. MG754419]